MKISLCSIGFRKTGLLLDEIAERISAIGFDGIELWSHHIDGREPEAVASILAENNLKVSMISPYFDLTGPEASREKALHDTDYYTDFAAGIGAPLIRVFTGTVGSFEATEAQFLKCVKALRQMCDIAAANGLGLALETHPRTLVDTVPASLALLDAVDKDNLSLNLDIFHMWEVHYDPVAVLEWLFDRTSHVHAKNAKIPPNSHYPLLHDLHGAQDIAGVTPLADGNMPYPGFLKSLKEKGFGGYVSIEWFGPNVEDIVGRELSYLHSALG